LCPVLLRGAIGNTDRNNVNVIPRLSGSLSATLFTVGTKPPGGCSLQGRIFAAPPKKDIFVLLMV
jgi:hypothetical protein